MFDPSESAASLTSSGGDVKHLSPDTMDDGVTYFSPAIANYFQAVPHLNELRNLAFQAVGPSAYDLVNMLNREALRAGFEPVSAYTQGVSTDSFFAGNPEFQALEEQLAGKIGPDNVSEVFELLKESHCYKPSQRVLGVIERTYKRLIVLSRAESGVDLQNPD
jgi:hypothetical protein